MAYLEDGYITDRPAAQALPAQRVAFIQKTYAHVVGAILAFAGIEALLLSMPGTQAFIGKLFGWGTGGMLVLMAVFIGGGYLARWWAYSATSRSTQYAGLALYVLLEVIIF